MTFTVQHNDGDGWITGVREDLYDGTNDEVLEHPAVFDEYESALQYVSDIKGLMHCGPGDTIFRICDQNAGQ